MKIWSTAESTLIKLKLLEVPPTGAENYLYVVAVCEKEKICGPAKTFGGDTTTKALPQCWRLCRNWFHFFLSKGIDMLKIKCLKDNLTQICLHKSTSLEYYPFRLSDSEKVFHENIRMDMAGGASILFTHKTVVDVTIFRKSSNSFISNIGSHASQSLSVFYVPTTADMTTLDMSLTKIYKASNTIETTLGAFE